jgi:hypothetical protein
MRSFILSHFQIKISEIHLQVDVQGYDFTVLDFHRIKAKSRNNRLYDDVGSGDSRYYTSRSFQGFMMGSGDYLLRVYNKTKEIKKIPNKNFIEELWKTNSQYVEGNDVYRIEFQIRREKLKNLVIDGQIMDGFEIILNNLNNIWAKMLNDFSLRNIGDKESIEIMLGYRISKNGKYYPLGVEAVRQRFKRSEVHPLWDLIKDFNGHYATDVIETFIKPFTNDFVYVHNAFKAFLSTSQAHYGCLRPDTLATAILDVEKYTNEKHKKTVLEDVLSKKLDRFNKLVIEDKVYENMQRDRDYFINALVGVIDNRYLEIFDKGISDRFIDDVERDLKGLDMIISWRNKHKEQNFGVVA